MPNVTFTLRTFGLEMTRSLRANVVFTPSRSAAIGPDGIRIRREVVPFSAIDSVTGVGVARLAQTTLLRPATHYIVSIEWLDGPADGWGEINWPLHVPAAGGDLGDLIRLPAPSAAAVVTQDTPPNDLVAVGGLWVDTSSSPLVLRKRAVVDGIPTWIEVGDLVGLTVEQPIVTHGTDANAARPNVTGRVIWVGEVVPVALRDGDILMRGSAMPWSPHRMPGLHVWHDPRAITVASGATVQTFPDVSGSGRHLQRAEGEGSMTLDTSGPTPFVRTAGAAIYRTASFPAISGPVTVVANIRVTNTSSTGYIIGGSTSSSASGFGIYRSSAAWGARRGVAAPPIASTSGATGDLVAAVLVADGTNSRLYIEGTLVASGALSTESLSRWAIGARYEGSSMSQVAGSGSMVGDHAVAGYAMPVAEVAQATAWLQSRRVA